MLVGVKLPSFLSTKSLVTLAGAYFALVRLLRYRRRNELEKKYGSGDASGIDLTPEEAQRIMFVCSEYDMPLLNSFSIIFALFKTYGIVSP